MSPPSAFVVGESQAAETEALRNRVSNTIFENIGLFNTLLNREKIETTAAATQTCHKLKEPDEAAIFQATMTLDAARSSLGYDRLGKDYDSLRNQNDRLIMDNEYYRSLLEFAEDDLGNEVWLEQELYKSVKQGAENNFRIMDLEEELRAAAAEIKSLKASAAAASTRPAQDTAADEKLLRGRVEQRMSTWNTKATVNFFAQFKNGGRAPSGVKAPMT